MGLPWVRLDTNVGQHDKILALIHDPSPKRWQALSSYFCAIAWSGGQGTDGKIPDYALNSVHGTHVTARLLVVYRLWSEGITGWEITNYASRQELDSIAEAKRASRSVSGRKAACERWHGKQCGCWRTEQAHA